MKGIAKKTILFLLLLALLAFGFFAWQNRRSLSFRDCLNETAFTYEGEDVEMKWLGFYVVYEERVVEEQAKIYNSQNTQDYWNLHIDGNFVRQAAKDTIMNMAIHDYIFYTLAKEEGMTLDAEEQRSLENAETDFWMDLLDEQVDNLPVTDEYLVESMTRIAYAQKYQAALAERENATYASYGWDGGYYKKWLEDQDVKINDGIWDRISIGNITLTHDKTNYVNGYNEEEEE